jgi:hypothetical protein
MNRLSLVLLVVPVLTVGCTSSYTVHVNGFSELGQPIKKNASIYVAVDPNSRNPIFDNEIKTKIEILLKSHGYAPVTKVDQAAYRLIFQVGLDSHSVSGYTPLYRPYMAYHDRYWGYYHFGYTGYVPYVDTYYDQWLVMKVFVPEPDAAKNEKVIWIGEAMLSTDSADPRRIVDYLLIAGFEYFGEDTKRQMVAKLSPDDPRIIQITTLP